jgi:hypothetical protein
MFDFTESLDMIGDKGNPILFKACFDPKADDGFYQVCWSYLLPLPCFGNGKVPPAFQNQINGLFDLVPVRITTLNDAQRKAVSTKDKMDICRKRKPGQAFINPARNGSEVARVGVKFTNCSSRYVANRRNLGLTFPFVYATACGSFRILRIKGNTTSSSGNRCSTEPTASFVRGDSSASQYAPLHRKPSAVPPPGHGPEIS